jgi:hypothetical protein
MTLQQTRRAVLATGTSLAVTALVGCSAVPGFGPDSDGAGPDAGGDSYGIVVSNDTDETYPVTVTAGPRGEDPFFEETVESTPDEDHEWDSVLTGEGLFVVAADVDAEHFHEELSQTQRTVTVGTENSMDVEDVLVYLRPEADGVVLDVDMDWRR